MASSSSGGGGCGNGSIEPVEQCDGGNLGGASCTSVLGEAWSGTLACTPACTFDTSGCQSLPSCITDGAVYTVPVTGQVFSNECNCLQPPCNITKCQNAQVSLDGTDTLVVSNDEGALWIVTVTATADNALTGGQYRVFPKSPTSFVAVGGYGLCQGCNNPLIPITITVDCVSGAVNVTGGCSCGHPDACGCGPNYSATISGSTP